LQYTGERAGDEWAGDMPKLSEIEMSQSKAPLSAERKGKINGTSKGRTGMRSGKTPPIQTVTSGALEPIEIRSNTERKDSSAKSEAKISIQTRIQNTIQNTIQTASSGYKEVALAKPAPKPEQKKP